MDAINNLLAAMIGFFMILLVFMILMMVGYDAFHDEKPHYHPALAYPQEMNPTKAILGGMKITLKEYNVS